MWALPPGIARLRLLGCRFQSKLLADFALALRALLSFVFVVIARLFSQVEFTYKYELAWPVLDRKPSRPEISSGHRDQALDLVHSTTAWHSKVAWRTWRGVPGLLSLY